MANASGLATVHTTGECVPPRGSLRGARRRASRCFGLDRWYVLAEAKALPDESVRRLEAQSSLIELPSARYDVRMLGAPNDPRYSEQPHLPAVGLPAAWSITAGDPSVVVAVVDSGIDMTHPDLRINQWANMGEVCGNGLDDDNNGFIDDCRGYNFADNTGSDLQGDGSHGTHCAGIVAADSDNGIGVAGTAGGTAGRPGASLMILTTFGAQGTGGFDEAIVYGADMGAAISSNSWGYTSVGAYDQAVLDAIDYFNTYGGGNVSDGGIVVFAAGNDNSDGQYYPRILRLRCIYRHCRRRLDDLPPRSLLV